jgi:hypothetical protein
LTGLRHVDRVALHRGLRHGLEVLRRQRELHAVEAGLAVGIVLPEHGDLVEAQRGELLDDQPRLVVVGGAQVEGVAVEGLAQRHGAGEGREEGRLRRRRQRQGRQAGGGADVAEQRQRVVREQLAGVLGAAVRLVAVVEAHEFDGPAVHAALRVDLVEAEPGALVELDAELGGRAGEGGGLRQQDPIPLGAQAGHCHECRGARNGPVEVTTVEHCQILCAGGCRMPVSGRLLT